MFTVVGLSAYFHDSACCLLRDGALVAAAQEERFSRRKHDDALPLEAFQFCLKQARLTIADIDCIAYYEDPRKKLERQFAQMASKLTPQLCLELWQRARLPMSAIVEQLGYRGEIDIGDHHRSHAASAFFFSGFPEAAILTVDSVGEWTTTTYGAGRGDVIDVVEDVSFPHSLGLLYSTVTSFLGFTVNDGEYKVMGLAAYGEPRYVEQVRALVTSGPSGQFTLNLKYFDFTRADVMYTEALCDLLGGRPRPAGDPILPFHQDVARSLQTVLEDVLIEKARALHDRVPVENLCMAGGVALNCVANGRLLREGPFTRLFVQPAAGDAGGALGAAVLAHVRRHRGAAVGRALEDVYLGPSYDADDVADVLASLGIGARAFGDERALVAAVVDLLVDGRIVAWFHGRMEFGPRALGARSILADPRDPAMRDRVNRLIKERESFRPFAPAVLESFASRHFDLDHPSPFMLETCRVVSPLPLPAITHVDGTARVQTVDGRSNRRFARLLEAFNERTGCPMLLNTSFNLRDEPIVASPLDALGSFARAPLDALVLEDFIVDRARLPPGAIAMWQRARAGRTPALDHVYTF